MSHDHDHLKHIDSALKTNSFEDIEIVARHYFARADCEFMNTYNAYNPKKLSNKIQRAKDHYKGNTSLSLYQNISLNELIRLGQK